MPGESDLPTVFAQRTVRNERIGSLLSSVLMRSVRPQYTYAIRRHPLSLWTTRTCHSVGSKEDEENSSRQAPTVLFLENPFAPESLKIISQVLKKAISESGFLVAEFSPGKADSIAKGLTNIFHPSAIVFVIDIASGSRFQHIVQGSTLGNHLAGVVFLDPTYESESCINIPQLLLLSKMKGPNDFRTVIRHHISEPKAVVVALPETIAKYGDDGSYSLWIARTVLKWMKAVRMTKPGTVGPVRSRL